MFNEDANFNIPNRIVEGATLFLEMIDQARCQVEFGGSRPVLKRFRVFYVLRPIKVNMEPVALGGKYKNSGFHGLLPINNSNRPWFLEIYQFPVTQAKTLEY